MRREIEDFVDSYVTILSKDVTGGQPQHAVLNISYNDGSTSIDVEGVETRTTGRRTKDVDDEHLIECILPRWKEMIVELHNQAKGA